jgi:hypothetical protein
MLLLEISQAKTEMILTRVRLYFYCLAEGLLCPVIFIQLYICHAQVAVQNPTFHAKIYGPEVLGNLVRAKT